MKRHVPMLKKYCNNKCSDNYKFPCPIEAMHTNNKCLELKDYTGAKLNWLNWRSAYLIKFIDTLFLTVWRGRLVDEFWLGWACSSIFLSAWRFDMCPPSAPLRKHLPAEVAHVTRLFSLFHQNCLHLRGEHAQEKFQSFVYALKGTIEGGGRVLLLSKDPEGERMWMSWVFVHESIIRLLASWAYFKYISTPLTCTLTNNHKPS